MKIDEFDYELPKELIAQKPSERQGRLPHDGSGQAGRDN